MHIPHDAIHAYHVQAQPGTHGRQVHGAEPVEMVPRLWWVIPAHATKTPFPMPVMAWQMIPCRLPIDWSRVALV